MRGLVASAPCSAVPWNTPAARSAQALHLGLFSIWAAGGSRELVQPQVTLACALSVALASRTVSLKGNPRPPPTVNVRTGDTAHVKRHGRGS
jgi:hypothetical protein